MYKDVITYINKTMNATSNQPGILIPKKDQRTSAQLPSPFMAINKTSKTGSVSRRYSRSGPHVGTRSFGRRCRYNCLIESEIPTRMVVHATTKYVLKKNRD